ncbi:MAG: NADPH-dependent FMN reductase [Burkholderiales bacterium]
MKVLAIPGSLRAGSFNRMAVNLCHEVMPAGMTMDICEIKDIPLFDGDDFAKGFPPAVAAFREKIRAADGLLIASPEYNYSVSGVVKNAIDWASRGTDQPFNWKPICVLSATMGPVGGARSQYEVRKIFQFLNGHVMPKPEVFIGVAQTKFDATGKMADEATRKVVTDFMVSFNDWMTRVKRMAA